jgi:hypothetical protein
VSVADAVSIGFAVAVVLSASALIAAAVGRVSRRAVLAVAGAVAIGAVAGWVAFALEPVREVAVAVAGITVCLLVAAAAVLVQRAATRRARLDQTLEEAEERLRATVREQTKAHAAELEHRVARTHADVLSRLAEDERRLADERRRQLVERERTAGAEMAEALAAVQRRVETRLAGWAEDLERSEQRVTAEVARLAERQRHLISDAETKIATDVASLQSGSDEQRLALVRLREELAKAAQQIVEASSAELDAHAAERRRALHELAERLRRRERELAERIGREETEVVQRIQLGFADVERKALEQLERAVERSSTRLVEAATLEFAGHIKSAREDAARRLSRELDRAVESFAREASTVLAERLAQVADAGTQRLEKRLSQAAAGLERQRDEIGVQLAQRLTEAEEELRQRLRRLAADVESERTVLLARLDEVARRLDDAALAGPHRLR